MTMETSTPQQRDLRRQSLLHATAVASPLRRSMAHPLNTSALLAPADAEKERSQRRSVVQIQKRLSNISASPLGDSGQFLEDHQIQDTIRVCAKMYAENRISVKNAWQIHIIEAMGRIVKTDSSNVLQVVGSSLDIGAKVYGLRVDDVHAKGLQLASSMAKSSEKQSAQENEEEGALDTSASQPQRRRTSKKKVRKMAADKRNTVDKDGKSCFGSIKQTESAVFATKENIEVSAIDNLFTRKLPTNPGNHQLMLLSDKKYCSAEPDLILADDPDRVLDITFPTIVHHDVCGSFKDFEIGTWDPEAEEKILTEAPSLPDVVLDDDGLPIAELDGSVHDIFQGNDDACEDPPTDSEEQQDVFQAQLHGEIAHIVDAVPEQNRVLTDYGFNTLVKTNGGKFIDKLWAGPSHWKVKFNRRSTARFSGTSEHHAPKHSKKAKVVEPLSFTSLSDEDVGSYTLKRLPPTTSSEKVTLPVPEIDLFFFLETLTQELLMKPGVQKATLNRPHPEEDLEVNVYNYENPNDSLYCSQNNNDGDPDIDAEPANSFQEDTPVAAQQQFLDENLVDAPETVSSTHIKYALHAKKMDMKKLKSTIWKILTGASQSKVKPMKFSTLYESLPPHLTPDMAKELTCPLAVVALLHLCNENSLELRQNESKDFTVVKAVES